MRRIFLVAAAVLAVLASIASGAAARTAAVGPVGATLRLVQRAPQVASVDLGAPGVSPGDALVFRSDLFDQTNTEQVGDLNITCTQMIGPENLCRGIFTLTDLGRLSVDALPVFPQPTVGIVNGGSGAFQLSRGEVHIDPRPDGTTSLTFHLFG